MSNIQGTNKKTITEYDIIRVFATILVVLGHSAYTTMQTAYGGIQIDAEFSAAQNLLELFVRLIYTFHMPLFFALSGALFRINVEKRGLMPFRNLCSNKFRRLIVPFILVTVFYVLPLKFFSGYYEASQSVLGDMVLGQVLLLGNSHLWFLVALFWIFLMEWLLERYVKNPKVILFIVIGLFIFGNLVEINFLAISKACVNLLWFHMGAIFETNRERFDQWIVRHRIPVMLLFGGLYCVCLVVYLLLFKSNFIVYGMLAFLAIATMYSAAGLLKDWGVQNRKGYSVILRYSFPIYLYSDTLNYVILAVIKKIGFTNLFSEAWFCVLLFCFRAVITTAVAILIACIGIKCSHFLKKRK